MTRLPHASSKAPASSPAMRTAVWAAGVLEVLLAAGYTQQDAAYHWLVHLFSGGATALLLAAAVLLLRRRPPARPGHLAVVAVVAGHLLAAFPDVLFALGRPHRPWMNVFLAHLAAHGAPGGTWGLLALFLAALAGYLILADRLSNAPAAGPSPGGGAGGEEPAGIPVTPGGSGRGPAPDR